jgi:hypothetical protein
VSSSARAPPTSAFYRFGVRHRSSMQRSSSSFPVGGAVLVPAFYAADAAVAPAPTAELVTSAVETTSDCSTGTLLPKTSWPEVFLPLSDVVRGAMCRRTDLNQNGRTVV